MEGNDLLADLDAFLAEHEAELIEFPGICMLIPSWPSTSTAAPAGSPCGWPRRDCGR